MVEVATVGRTVTVKVFDREDQHELFSSEMSDCDSSVMKTDKKAWEESYTSPSEVASSAAPERRKEPDPASPRFRLSVPQSSVLSFGGMYCDSKNEYGRSASVPGAVATVADSGSNSPQPNESSAEYFASSDGISVASDISSIGGGKAKDVLVDTPPSSLHTTPLGMFSREASYDPPQYSLEGPAACGGGSQAVESMSVKKSSPKQPEPALPMEGQPSQAAAAAAAAVTLSSTTMASMFRGSQQVPFTMAISPGATSVTPPRHPVLYSAIGSLEDPSNNSFVGWKNIQKQQQLVVASRFDFDSTTLLPPANQTKTVRSKIAQALERGGSSRNDASSTGASSSLLIKPQEQQSESPQTGSHLAAAETGGDNFAVGSAHAGACGAGAGAGAGAETLSSDIQKETSVKPAEKEPPATGLRSIMRSNDDRTKVDDNRKVTISVQEAPRRVSKNKKNKKGGGPIEMFRPSSDAYTPRMGKKEIKYKPAEMRTPVQKMASPLGTLSRPNFKDALRRVAMIIHQHIVKIERRFENKTLRGDDGLFKDKMRDEFSEEVFATPTYRCTMVRVPMARPGMVYGLKKKREHYAIPSEGEIYEFAHRLFKAVKLSSECSIVCLIYVERLMEVANVPLLASTWRPIFMCGLLLASKVWQDLSSWNIEFASVYPQYSLDAINRLELQFLRLVKWDLYISSTLYAKYYFALRSLVEKPDFRQRYNRMVGGVDSVQASEALKIEKRSTIVKEEALLQISRSM